MELSYTFVAAFGLIGAFIGLIFAAGLAIRVLKSPDGNEKMVEIAKAVREGAGAYLKQQYLGVSIFFLIISALLVLLSYLKYFTFFIPIAFLVGGLFSAVAGYIGMAIATRASSRTAQAAITSLNKALQVSFSGGAVMGFVVVGLGTLYVAIWFFVLRYFFSHSPEFRNMDTLQLISQTILPFGIGASAQALFARVGGGIFTKAADVGADLVGKIEAGIPEDDPRNPAVIADNVGDNVGDVAGMGADLFESYVGSIIAAMALAASAGLGFAGMALPLGLAACGIVASIIGFFFIRTGETASQEQLLKALRSGVIVASIAVAIFSFFLVPACLGKANFGFFWAIIAGLTSGVLISLATEYFTSSFYSPVKNIADSALTGPGTVIISGIGVGMMATALPVIFVSAAILCAFWCSGGIQNFSQGLYGIGIASVGLLSTLSITLASDAYGPIADNAGGNAQMAGLDPKVRQRTDALDSLGNTTAATGKGFAIASAALTALVLIVAYKDLIVKLGGPTSFAVSNPRLIVGLFIGGMLPFVFCALLMNSVGRAASKVVVEVRRQFKEIKGLLDGTGKPEYGHCVQIVTAAAQKEMLAAASLALVAPALVGWLLGVEGEVGLLLGALVSGFVLAVFMAAAGGAWDNAKKYIEEGAHGGKGSAAHKAAVVGDTVGDPFKDTAGPSLNILIKLMSMVAIVLASFILKNSLF
ncbi:MAG: sodium-translocating pyrophosphatase [Candidatus Omnitrophica bacterium]|nr:sodium-translocating pyrophosphatase [Candidatus Omnitrophota bacterium]